METEVPSELQNIVNYLSTLLPDVCSIYDGEDVHSMEDRLNLYAKLEPDAQKKEKILSALNAIKEFYKQSRPLAISNAKIIIMSDDAEAFLTLIPPNFGGKYPSLFDIKQKIRQNEIIYGINTQVLEKAYDKFKKGQTIYRLKFASFQPPEKGKDGYIELFVKGIDKCKLFSLDSRYKLSEPEVVSPKRLAAVIYPPTAGKPGLSLSGKNLPGLKGKQIKLKLHGLREVKEEDMTHLISERHGYLILDEESISVGHLYIFQEDIKPPFEIPIEPGASLFIEGNVIGQLELKAKDIFVLGKVEEACLNAYGDIYVRDGIIGKRKSIIDCGGRVYTKFISDAEVFCVGDIIVEQAITYSNLNSNGRVILKNPDSIITGGNVSALKKIVTERLGSEFGTFTSLSVGRQSFKDIKLSQLTERLQNIKNTLNKIRELKNLVSCGKVNLSAIPAEKQDLFISALKSEERLQNELVELEALADKITQSSLHTEPATVEVKKEIMPPVRIQLEEYVEEIKSPVKGVEMFVEQDGKVKFNFLGK